MPGPGPRGVPMALCVLTKEGREGCLLGGGGFLVAVGGGAAAHAKLDPVQPLPCAAQVMKEEGVGGWEFEEN